MPDREPSFANPANVLTVLRVALVPVFPLLAFTDRPRAALAVFVAAAATDFLDGWVARTFGWRSRLGARLDVAADRFLLVVAFASLPFLSTGLDSALVAACASAVLVRHLALAAVWGALRRIGAEADLTTTGMGKIATALQMATVAAILWPLPSEWLVRLCAATLVATFYSGGEYLWQWAMRWRDHRRRRVRRPGP